MTDSSLSCPVCACNRAHRFVTAPRVPVLCNILWPDKAAAQAVRRVDIDLAYCPVCGHIFNPDFRLELMDYTAVYENSLHFSPTFQSYAQSLAQDLVARHDLHGKSIVEIGSGKGDFLEMLCELGNSRGVGFDPSYVPGETARSKTEQITFVQDFYSEKYTAVAADFLCCRHTLEHIPDPRAFLQMLRRTLGERTETHVFFEVPNALATLRQLAIWDIIYEHCSYFSKYSLARLFTDTGFRVLDVQEVYGGQFLTIEAVPAGGEPVSTAQDRRPPAALADDVENFAVRYRRKVEAESVRLTQLAQQNRLAVVWGAGSKGISYLNVLDETDVIAYVVDINPRKQGMYITGTGQQIVAPAMLPEIGPDVVIVMNGIYAAEIGGTLAELGVEAELVVA